MKKPNSKNPMLCIACRRDKSIQVYFCDRCQELYPSEVLADWVSLYNKGEA